MADVALSERSQPKMSAALPSTASPKRTTSARHFVSGLGSGMATAVILQPLDLLKTRVQQSGRPSLYASWLDLRQTGRPWRSLWRGTVPSALRTGFGSALYFTTLNSIRQQIAQSSLLNGSVQVKSGSTALPTLSNSANMISGAVARTFAGLVLMPLTVIKVRFESNMYSYSSVLSAAKDIRSTEGIRGFFSGFGATAIRDAPYAGMYVLFYEMLKTHIGGIVSSRSGPEASAQSKMGTSLASSINFSSAILAGAACSAVSNPFDAVKTRIQLQPQRYRNTWQAWYRMITEEGVRSLFSGLGLRMSRKALSSALAWTVYEELIRKYGGR